MLVRSQCTLEQLYRLAEVLLLSVQNGQANDYIISWDVIRTKWLLITSQYSLVPLQRFAMICLLVKYSSYAVDCFESQGVIWTKQILMDLKFLLIVLERLVIILSPVRLISQFTKGGELICNEWLFEAFVDCIKVWDVTRNERLLGARPPLGVELRVGCGGAVGVCIVWLRDLGQEGLGGECLSKPTDS